MDHISHRKLKDKSEVATAKKIEISTIFCKFMNGSCSCYQNEVIKFLLEQLYSFFNRYFYRI